MIQNRLILLALSTIACGWYLTSLAAWAVGRYKPPMLEYRLLYWLQGYLTIKCKSCGFRVRWGWEFCPKCGKEVQWTLLQEVGD